MNCSTSLIFGLPPDYWTAIASGATVILAVVAVIPIFIECRARRDKAVILRKRIRAELETLADHLKKWRRYKSKAFEGTYRVCFDTLRELFHVADPLRPNEQEKLRNYVVDFRVAKNMDTREKFQAFLKETVALLETFTTSEGKSRKKK